MTMPESARPYSPLLSLLTCFFSVFIVGVVVSIAFVVVDFFVALIFINAIFIDTVAFFDLVVTVRVVDVGV